MQPFISPMMGRSPFGFPAPLATCTWNPADKGATLVLSSGNMRFDNGSAGAARLVRGTVSRTVGKLYFEGPFFGYAFGTAAGVATAGASLSSDVGAAGSVGYHSNTGVKVNGTPVGSTNLGTNTFVHGFAIDLTAQLFWAINWGAGTPLWNNDAAANPATGVNGTSFSALGSPGIALYPAGSTDGDAGQTEALLANFGASAFTGTIPSGFAPWNGY